MKVEKPFLCFWKLRPVYRSVKGAVFGFREPDNYFTISLSTMIEISRLFYLIHDDSINKREMKFTSSLHGAIIHNKRNCGNTSRIVDNTIQLIFQGERVKLIGEFDNNSRGCRRMLLERIKMRLDMEHNVAKRLAVIDKPNDTIIYLENELEIQEEARNDLAEQGLK